MASREGQHARSARRGGVWHHRKGSTHVVQDEGITGRAARVVQDEVGCGITGRAARVVSRGLGGVCHHGKGGTRVVQDEVGCGSTENRIPSI